MGARGGQGQALNIGPGSISRGFRQCFEVSGAVAALTTWGLAFQLGACSLSDCNWDVSFCQPQHGTAALPLPVMKLVCNLLCSWMGVAEEHARLPNLAVALEELRQSPGTGSLQATPPCHSDAVHGQTWGQLSMGMSEASRFRTCHADERCGAGGEDRTPDLRFTKPLHYRCATPAQAVISPALIELQAVPERGPSSRVRDRSALGRERSLLLPICYLIGPGMTLGLLLSPCRESRDSDGLDRGRV